MNMFFSDQGDFLLALQGLAFIILAVVCWSLGPQSRPSLPWRWLGLFAVLAGLERWLELMTPALHNKETLVICLWLLRTAALLVLLEFGRRGWPWRVAPLILFGLVVLVCLALAFWGGWRLPVWLLTLLAGAALIGPLRRQALPGSGIGGAVWMLLSGVHLWAFLLTAYALTPPAWTYEEVKDTGDLIVLHSLHQWLPLLLGVVSSLLLFLLLQSRKVQQRTPYLLWSLPLHVVVLVVGLVFINFAARIQAENNREALLQRAKTAAAALDPDMVTKLEGALPDMVKPEYAKVRKLLLAVRQSNPDTRLVRLFVAHGSRVVLLATSAPENAPEFAPPGQTYEEASFKMRRALRISNAFVEGPLEDKWGLWMSGFAPVGHITRTTPVALLCLDVSIGTWRASIFPHRLATLGLMLFVNLLLLALFTVLQISRESAQVIADTESRFRALFENAPEAALVVAVDSGRILDMNPFVCRLLGYTQEELRNRTVFELTVKDPDVLRRQLALAHESASPLTTESAYRCKDGRIVTVEITQTAFNFHAQQAVLAYVRDITGRRESEERLRKSMKELERFNRLMVGREQRVIELKQEVNALRSALGQPPAYTAVEPGANQLKTPGAP
jgi:PAS domain S-box-containing protein